MAKNKVATLRGENETLSRDNEKFIQENIQIRAQILKFENSMGEAILLLERVRGVTSGLYTLLESLRDQSMKDQAQANLVRNKGNQTQLEQRIDELERKIQESQILMEANSKTISINKSRFLRNLDEIGILSASITKTEYQKEQLNLLAKDVESLLVSTQGLLK